MSSRVTQKDLENIYNQLAYIEPWCPYVLWLLYFTDTNAFKEECARLNILGLPGYHGYVPRHFHPYQFDEDTVYFLLKIFDGLTGSSLDRNGHFEYFASCYEMLSPSDEHYARRIWEIKIRYACLLLEGCNMDPHGMAPAIREYMVC